ncbi:MAG: PASTA domain-containing protein [Bacteroidetes bacterium]|nr:PASTA domain-containing protein [Bacteroidota bacterium]
MDFLRFLFSKKFLKHLLLATGIFAVLVWLTLQSLAFYTHHNDYLIVPDFRGLDLQNIRDNPDFTFYHFSVIDSLFDPDKPKGSVLTQDPFPGSKVKKDRTIYLTITSFVPEKTTMPDLRDLTLRQAQSMIESAGLKLGKLQYIRSFDEDAVQNQFFKGRVIRPGASIDKGSVITLTVGMGAKAAEAAADSVEEITR